MLRALVFSTFFGLALFFASANVQAAEVKVHGHTLIPWASKIDTDRYRSPRNFEQTLRWYRKFFAGHRYIHRYREVNIPGVKYVHYENKNPKSTWSGINIYQKGPRGRVLIYVIKRLDKTHDKCLNK